jgi:hypothetical protein
MYTRGAAPLTQFLFLTGEEIKEIGRCVIMNIIKMTYSPDFRSTAGYIVEIPCSYQIRKD